jgi:hypothetical protein
VEEESIARLAQRVRDEVLARALAGAEAKQIVSNETAIAVQAQNTQKVQAINSDASYGESVALNNGDASTVLDAVCIEAGGK